MYPRTQHNIPEDQNRYQPLCENPKPPVHKAVYIPQLSEVKTIMLNLLISNFITEKPSSRSHIRDNPDAQQD
jgi:hypothetical protein